MAGVEGTDRFWSDEFRWDLPQSTLHTTAAGLLGVAQGSEGLRQHGRNFAQFVEDLEPGADHAMAAAEDTVVHYVQTTQNPRQREAVMEVPGNIQAGVCIGSRTVMRGLVRALDSGLEVPGVSDRRVELGSGQHLLTVFVGVANALHHPGALAQTANRYEDPPISPEESSHVAAADHFLDRVPGMGAIANAAEHWGGLQGMRRDQIRVGVGLGVAGLMVPPMRRYFGDDILHAAVTQAPEITNPHLRQQQS